MAKTVRKLAAGAGAALLVLTLLPAPFTAWSAEYPRRIAVAPFVNLTGQEEIKPVVAVLPRLIATRLMALAGAETLLLPGGEKPAEEAAKESRVPLLLQGTVSKVGKGYSIDATVTDVSAGAPAGAFFASAATEDEIIPQIGVLAAEMVEKLFGVKAARPQAAPAAAAPAVPAPAAAAGAPAVSGARAATPVPAPGTAPASAATGPPAAATPVPVAPAGPWEPRKVEKIAMSDKIPDLIFRISAGDMDGDGAAEVAAIGSHRLFVYKVKDDKVFPFRKMEEGVSHLFLNVEVADVDGDGKSEIVITDLTGGHLRSFVMRVRGDSLERAASGIPFFVVALDDGKGGRRLAGQRMGFSEPFSGKVVFLRWDAKEKSLVPDGDVPTTVSQGIFGLAAFPGDAENRYLYIDADEHLRIVDRKGKTAYKTKEYFSGAVHGFPWGKESPSSIGPEPQFVRGRIYPIVQEGRPPVFIVRQSKGNTVLKDLRAFDWSRLVLLGWGGDGFSEKGGSEKIDNLMTDFAVVGGAGPGMRLAVPVIDWSASPFSRKEETTRLHIYGVE